MNRVDRTSDKTDYMGLSTDIKEVENICNGTTFWEVDTSKLFIFYNGTWYEQK